MLKIQQTITFPKEQGRSELIVAWVRLAQIFKQTMDVSGQLDTAVNLNY